MWCKGFGVTLKEQWTQRWQRLARLGIAQTSERVDLIPAIEGKSPVGDVRADPNDILMTHQQLRGSQ